MAFLGSVRALPHFWGRSAHHDKSFRDRPLISTIFQNPDGVTTTFAYDSEGDLSQTTFQIYDGQGRMSELRTFKNLAGQPSAASPGSAATTWQYHPQRGFLTAKRDANNKGAS